MSLVNQSIIKHKMRPLNLAEELQNVSQACRVMGVFRDTFYRENEAKETGGMEALLHKDRWRASLKNRMDESIERAILAFAVENPAAGQVRVSKELRKLISWSALLASARCGYARVCKPSGFASPLLRKRWPRKASC